jgi:hypothetical protein
VLTGLHTAAASAAHSPSTGAKRAAAEDASAWDGNEDECDVEGIGSSIEVRSQRTMSWHRNRTAPLLNLPASDVSSKACACAHAAATVVGATCVDIRAQTCVDTVRIQSKTN